ncbi:hypothetical protein [Gracilibacillus sp. YIM 98692]|uniref:hypothetical protein n=1 Tax=Gracilibacillus sp. YIM 98692 TaxID=2663532 RepID=UPI0013CF7D00|nr:hypothetical protein [Gracilibacillus sp. YIM 98692]
MVGEIMDSVIKEINQFFQTLNFNKVVINDYENFEYKGKYYKLTKAGFNYYLECALSLDEAQKNLHEDVEPYSAKLYPPEKLKEIIKNDIMKFIVNGY